MTTHINTKRTRLATLTEAWRALLTKCPLPEPALVSLEPTVNRITIQAGGSQDPLDHLPSCCYGPTPWSRSPPGGGTPVMGICT